MSTEVVSTLAPVAPESITDRPAPSSRAPRLINRYWYGAFYMLKCTSRAGQRSPALYGVWNMSDNPVCNNAEFNNYNSQPQHYGCAAAQRLGSISSSCGSSACKRRRSSRT